MLRVKIRKVVDFFHNGANGVCEVCPEKNSMSQKKFLFPVTQQVLLEINKEKKLLVVELLVTNTICK